MARTTKKPGKIKAEKRPTKGAPKKPTKAKGEAPEPKSDTSEAKPKEQPCSTPQVNKEKKPSPVKVVKETRHLAVVLTPAEVRDRSDSMARLLDDISGQEAELKSFSSTIKARVATLEGQLATAKQEYQNKRTYRDIDCDQIHDYDARVVRVIRTDTGEEIERRDMTASELQLPLPKGKAPEKDGTETMSCHGNVPSPTKVSMETVTAIKGQATERLNDEGDLTASALRARKRTQEALHAAIEEVEEGLGSSDDEPEAPKKRRGKVDVSSDPTGKKWDNDDEPEDEDDLDDEEDDGETDEDDDGIIDA